MVRFSVSRPVTKPRYEKQLERPPAVASIAEGRDDEQRLGGRAGPPAANLNSTPMVNRWRAERLCASWVMTEASTPAMRVKFGPGTADSSYYDILLVVIA
jgi:hypothetical protein